MLLNKVLDQFRRTKSKDIVTSKYHEYQCPNCRAWHALHADCYNYYWSEVAECEYCHAQYTYKEVLE